jgi:hypothetical protein
MAARRGLGLFLSLVLSVSTACTTGRMVPQQVQPGAAAGAPLPLSGLKAGERLRVHTRDGRHMDLNLDRVSGEGDVFGQQQEHVRAADIAMVERRSVNKVRTTLLLATVGMGALLVIAIVDIASNGLDLPSY